MKAMAKLALVGAVILAACCFGIAFGGEKSPAKVELKVGEYKITGPFTHENLTIFLVHGKDKLKGKTFITLEDALEKKVVVVSETGEVQKLIIENKSKDKYIYVQSGDIIKGGKQDRVIRFDLAIPPKSGKIPLGAYCVEQGRWSGRGKESARVFGLSTMSLPSKALKMGVKKEGNQPFVWSNVSKEQAKLSANLDTTVNAPASRSSLQLSLENPKLEMKTKEYMDELSKIIEGKDDVIGFVFAVNGEVNSADIYSSRTLFRKLWPKLLKSSAFEAIAEYKKDKKFGSVKEEGVRECLVDAEKAKASDTDISASVRMRTRETDKTVLFETLDREGKAWLHRSYIVK